MTKRIHISAVGRVQGVGYRFFVHDIAASMNLSGWVRNCFDGAVEMEVQGEPEALDLFCEKVKKGPALAEVTGFEIREITKLENELNFKIKH